MRVALGIAAILAIGVLVYASQAQTSYASRADVQTFVDEMVGDDGFDKDQLLSLFDQAQRKDSILEAIARPAEKTWAWHEYRDLFVEELRIEQALEFWSEHAETLSRAQAVYGVAPEYVLAILGVETRFGRVMGGYRVLDALTTLGFDYPPRADFFRGELAQFLVLAREEGKDPAELLGSYAGAMGYGQFIPSSFRAYAVDFDGDGVRDIWQNPTDAIGSIANYFAEHGWRNDRYAAVQVRLTDQSVAALANQGLDLGTTIGALRARGVVAAHAGAEPWWQAAAEETPAALYRLTLADGEAFQVALNDFHVITRYNRSHLYAMAVIELAGIIRMRHDAQQRNGERSNGR